MLKYPLIIDYADILNPISRNKEKYEKVFNIIRELVEEKQIKIKLPNSDYLWNK
jgi:hypothetical protein